METEQQIPNKKKSSKKIIIFLIVILAIGFFAYKQIRLRNNPELQAKKAIATIESKLKKHMILPQGEVPLIAEIKDVEKLKKEQLFFADAENGDTLIIYQNISKAIIYSNTKDLIVNAGPLTRDTPQTIPPIKK